MFYMFCSLWVKANEYKGKNNTEADSSAQLLPRDWNQDWWVSCWGEEAKSNIFKLM